MMQQRRVSRHTALSAVDGYTGVQWAVDGRSHTCQHMGWRHFSLLCLMMF